MTREEAAQALSVHPNVVLSWGERGWLETADSFTDGTVYTAKSVDALRERIGGSLGDGEQR
jgi:hypothetical protein